uniref:Uncharacterized protein n=1 Tax=Anguilla anguilla TaxID=7936 RepID=A0A0E9WT88_ANGAN
MVTLFLKFISVITLLALVKDLELTQLMDLFPLGLKNSVGWKTDWLTFKEMEGRIEPWISSKLDSNFTVVLGRYHFRWEVKSTWLVCLH